LIVTSPSSVGTPMLPPRVAALKLIGTSHERCAPSRSKIA
jgi:hypothetical protein